MNYTLKSLTPMLETKDLYATKDFYTQILGFLCSSFSDEWGWMNLIKDEIAIMFTPPNRHRNIAGPIMSGSLYFNAENIDELWEELKDKCKVYYPIGSFEYGMREFAIYDNNGYLLQFGKEIQNEN